MQLKLELPGIKLNPPMQQLWSKLDPHAQRSVIQVLAKIMTKALTPKVGQQKANEEDAHNGQQ
jgi:hypothetical protein